MYAWQIVTTHVNRLRLAREVSIKKIASELKGSLAIQAIASEQSRFS